MYDDDYDDREDGFADFLATLAEDGEGYCDHHGKRYPLTPSEQVNKYGAPVDYTDPGCPECAAVDAMRAQIAAGEVEADSVCFGCESSVSETDFMGQRLCWACYQAIAAGRHRPDRCRFADPGGRSALRAAGPGNPRVHPCPTCRAPNRLTPQDRERGYQCDSCADRAEGGWDY